MSHYTSCPTCGFGIGQVVSKYKTKYRELCSNDKLTEEQRSKENSKLLMSLGLRRYCCRSRIMSQVDLAEIIVPADRDEKD